MMTSKTKAMPCGHCRSARMVATLADLLEANRRRPLPMLGRMLVDLKMVYGGGALFAMCPGCLCVTQDMSSASVH